MLAYIVRRVLATIPSWRSSRCSSSVCSTSRRAIRPPSSPATRRRPRTSSGSATGLGLDRPFLVRFAEWVLQILRGDLGMSIFTGLPVTELIQPAHRADAVADGRDADPRRRRRRADRRDRGLESRHLDRPHGDGVRGARLLGAGLRRRLSAGLHLRAAARLAAGAGLHAARQGLLALAREPDPAGDRARLRLHRADRPHHARHHARGAEPGLHPHRARQGRWARAPSCSCTR